MASGHYVVGRMHRRPIKLVITLQGGGYLHVMNIIMDTALGVQHVTRFKKKKNGTESRSFFRKY